MTATQQTARPAIDRPKQLLVRASLTLLGFAAISKLMTIAVDSFVAARFGLTVDADAYLVAIGFIGAILAAPSETLRLAIVPVCGRYLQRGDPRSASGVLLFVLISAVVLGSAVAIGFAVSLPLLARLAAPGFSAEGLETLARLMGVLTPSLVIGLVMALLLGVLHTQLRFGVPALAGLGLGAGVIGMGLLLGGSLGVTSLAVGYVAGMASVVAVLAWLSRGIFREGVSFRNVRKDMPPFMRLALPTGFAISIVSAGAIIERAVASATGVGNVAALGFAIKLITQASLLSQSIWTPLTPLLTATGATNAGEGDPRLVPFSIRLVLLVLAPATALLIALREPLVGVIFQHGAFTAADTQTTASLLALHSGSLPGEGMFMVAVAALLSFHDSSTRLIASGLLIGSKIGLMAILAPLIGVAGIALAASVSSLLAGAFAVRVLARRFAPGESRTLTILAGKALLAGLVVLVTAWALSALVSTGSGGDASFVTRLVQLMAGAMGAGIVYIGALVVLDVEEGKIALARMGRAVGRISS